MSDSSIERGCVFVAADRSPLARLANEFIVVARTGASLFGLDEGSPYPDVKEHRRRFEHANRAFFEIRDRWVTRYPAFAPRTAQALDIDSYAGANILVLAPHPDDEIIGCGGTLLKFIRAGARVIVVHATDGAASAALQDAPTETRGTIRLQEARTVAESIGFSETLFWKERNGAFECTEPCIKELRKTIESVRPTLVFTPFVTDVHDEHLVLNRVLARALENLSWDCSSMRVLSYEVWSLTPASTYCDVTDVMKRVEELLLLYKTAMKVDDFVHFCGHRNYYHAYTLTGGPGFVEAFHMVSAASFGALIRTAETSDG
jgi:LmbE family N-acetylglucosaminyl deacetylase